MSSDTLNIFDASESKVSDKQSLDNQSELQQFETFYYSSTENEENINLIELINFISFGGSINIKLDYVMKKHIDQINNFKNF